MGRGEKEAASVQALSPIYLWAQASRLRKLAGKLVALTTLFLLPIHI